MARDAMTNGFCSSNGPNNFDNPYFQQMRMLLEGRFKHANPVDFVKSEGVKNERMQTLIGQYLDDVEGIKKWWMGAIRDSDDEFVMGASGIIPPASLPVSGMGSVESQFKVITYVDLIFTDRILEKLQGLFDTRIEFKDAKVLHFTGIKRRKAMDEGTFSLKDLMWLVGWRENKDINVPVQEKTIPPSES